MNEGGWVSGEFTEGFAILEGRWNSEIEDELIGSHGGFESSR